MQPQFIVQLSRLVLMTSLGQENICHYNKIIHIGIVNCSCWGDCWTKIIS